MNVTKFEVEGPLLIEPKVFGDERGFFYESYRQDLFKQHGIEESFVQDNHVKSTGNVLRGLHYQIEPCAQAKLLRVIKGSIYDVAVDIRKGSPTFGKYVAVTLDSVEKKMFYIPKGFAHGYCSLGEESEVLYKVSSSYSPEHERGILWSDPSVGVQWPEVSGDYILSDKDKVYPLLEAAEVFA